jgi:D-beta-D-heptose 7-phosphate kinase/D-beta-D-heptose 1-phosphate adenosyltransferase
LIGDSCKDCYVYGEVKRINPEAPVPILNYKRTEVKNGMAWNVYNNLRSFGLSVYMLTNEEKIVKTRYIDEKTNQQILRLDEETEVKPMTYEIPNEKYDAIVISDYDKGFITKEKLFDIVYSAKCPVFIDSKKIDLPKDNCYIKINEYEYEKLKEKYNNIIITRGEKGAEYNGTIYTTEKIETRDIVGAGDTFLAGLVYGYLKYGTIEMAIPIANSSSRIAVSHSGTYVLTQNDIKSIDNQL